MVLEIVQKSHFIVSADSVGENKRFSSRPEKIPVFNNYSYYFLCKEENGNVGIFLYMECKKPVAVSCKITVNSITDNYVRTFEKSDNWGFLQFGNKSELFVDGFMTVDTKLKIKFISEKVEALDEVPHIVVLLDDDEFKDFVICVDGKEMKVHKNIIAVASPVFAAMLKPHCNEFKESKVSIKDFDFETVKAGVDVMYTRKIPDELSLDSLLNLYKFADKYDLIDAKKILDLLTEKISLETVLKITNFSLTNCLDTLYEKCVEFYAKDFEENSRKFDNFEQLDSHFVMDAAKRKYRPRRVMRK
uniref:BTB domain-containing protein n=1 Tax=Panagrolaimus sp. JU765 TaxID=591449 RepID=A0AC34RPD2_9BILA